MIIHGSINYSPCGRKRKTVTKRKKRVAQARTKPLAKPQYLIDMEEFDAKYPSMKTTSTKPDEDTSYKQEISSQYTIAVPYNKGAYQVIPKGDIKWIGK
tara:strand:- start:108 stop:404 length:297 start_codon:yes stop_codon:yes gene_type:complete